MLFEFDSDINEYLVVVSPSETITNNVSFFKKLYHERFGRAHYINSKAHISLCHFDLLSSRESALKQEFDMYLNQLKGFEIGVSGFHGFQKNGLVYLKTEKEEIIRVQRLLTTVLRQRFHISKQIAQVLREPHITIARSNNDKQYTNSWNYFKDITYEHKFDVDRITVLRRKRTAATQKSSYKLAFEVVLGQC
ncbi:2'-5' RNA ligase family protein [Kriegella aquimaris]|uniref:2'-5' RNA ligase n=1 Tax=Kriegella aquimaris TaxID=192904 RepID=A0A1G9IND1_9FLAO|nr:2'-5' RNA ligase family protein [Kriegella aquimaris]SDL26662.1 2'-5' RNA ligase [Kriegella aquimaris]